MNIQRFLSDGCGCDLANGPCSNTYTEEYIESYRCQCSDLSRAELDMAILGQLSAFTNSSTLSVHSSKHRHSPANRQRAYMLFYHGGRRVCKKMFLFLHNISDKRLRNLQESLRENGLTPRCHGNTRRLPATLLVSLIPRQWYSTCARMLRQMPFCCQGEFPVTSAQMCSFCPPAPPSVRCGSSTPPHFRTSTPLTTE